MLHSVVDTNVPLTAAGHNDVATDQCRLACVDFIESVFTGDIVVVLDHSGHALNEYGRKVPPRNRTNDLAGRFLIHLFSNIARARYVRLVELRRTPHGEYVDYPDNDGNWLTDDPKCKTFDEDDKKWVAIARRYRAETGQIASIANAADHCWTVFELYLNLAGVHLEFVCAPQPNTN